MHLPFTETGEESSMFRGCVDLPVYEHVQVNIPNAENWDDGQCTVLYYFQKEKKKIYYFLIKIQEINSHLKKFTGIRTWLVTMIRSSKKPFGLHKGFTGFDLVPPRSYPFELLNILFIT